MTWFGEDPESDLQSYEFSLGSSETSQQDILPLTATSGHRHYETYHPHLSNGGEFFVHITATNGAGLQTTAVSDKLFPCNIYLRYRL